MRKVIKTREECPTCARETKTQEDEIYCDICNKKMVLYDNVIDCIGHMCLSGFEELGNVWDTMDDPDLCSLKCLGKFLEKRTHTTWISLSIDNPRIMDEFTELLKRRG